MIRAFIAVELSEPVRQAVAGFQEELAKARADVKWVKTANLHLTLKFLGEIQEEQLPVLQQALQDAVKEFKPFTIQLEGIGAFPKTTYPRVVWVGIQTGKEELTKLASAVEAACHSVGFPEEDRLLQQAQDRSFSPHLTIGRVRSRDRLAALVKQLQTAEFQASSPTLVDHITLFQSTLSPHGPTYTPLASLPFV